MAQTRGPVMAWSGTLAGLGIASATLIATVGKKPVSNQWFILSVGVAIGATAIFLVAGLPDLLSWVSGGVASVRQALLRPQKLITDRWQYSSDGLKSRASMSLFDLALPGTGLRKQPDGRLSWTRFIILIPCSRISPDVDGKTLWAQFEAFLKRPPVTFLVGQSVNNDTRLQWVRWSTTRSGVLDAVLTPGTEDQAIAAARLELPDGSATYGRGSRCAMLILHFEPSRKDDEPAPASPKVWEERFQWVLELPQAFATFLAGQLGLTTRGTPPAHVAFRLEAPGDMAEMIDITGKTPLPGGQRSSQAVGYFTADRDGSLATEVVKRMMAHVLQYALKVEP